MLRLAAFAVLMGCFVTACSGQKAVVGACKTDLECPSGQVCGPKNVCAAATTCPDTPCADGLKCVNSRCLATSCGSHQCGGGQVCSNNACVDEGCIGKSCSSGVCIKGACYRPSCDVDACTGAEVCVNESCIARACLSVTCPGDQRCAADGQCYARGGAGGGSGSPTNGTGGSGGFNLCGGRCSPVQVCINNQCVEGRCVGVTCPADQACASGQCVSTSCGNGPCTGGQVCGQQGKCVDPACGAVACPTGYSCSNGLCYLSGSTGGSGGTGGGGGSTNDGGTGGGSSGDGYLHGPDGGIIGVRGPDGGLMFLDDGGIVGGPCLPGHCTEIVCNDGFDDDGNGLTDCLDPACASRVCNDHDACTLGDTCQGSACVPTQTLVCKSPPGMCYRNPGNCTVSGCSYVIDVGKPCGDNNVCLPDTTCGVTPVGGNFTFTPSNYKPADLVFQGTNVIVSGALTFDTSTGKFGGQWGTALPSVNHVTTPTGPAVVLASNGFELAEGAVLKVTGNQPLIIASSDSIVIGGTIDVSAAGPTQGPGGHLGCEPSSGAAGTKGANSSSGGGGAGGIAGPGGLGGAGSTFTSNVVDAGVAMPHAFTDLVGGCPGGTGGNVGGRGGAGGGVLQLSAALSIGLNGARLIANGSGGKAGTPDNKGGGGGGSGGLLFLEAPYVFGLDTRLIANGGGGGEGAGRDGAGKDGNDGDVNFIYAGAAGGIGGSLTGGAGGTGGAKFDGAANGRAGIQLTDTTTVFEGGGGGGGGAAGAVVVRVVPGGQCLFPYDRNVFSPGISTNIADRCGQQ